MMPGFGPILKVRSIPPTKPLFPHSFLGHNAEPAPIACPKDKRMEVQLRKNLPSPLPMGLCRWFCPFPEVLWPQAQGGNPGTYSQPPGMPCQYGYALLPTGPPVNVTCNIFINSFGSVTETTMVRSPHSPLPLWCEWEKPSRSKASLFSLCCLPPVSWS